MSLQQKDATTCCGCTNIAEEEMSGHTITFLPPLTKGFFSTPFPAKSHFIFEENEVQHWNLLLTIAISLRGHLDM